jgi:PTH2 family peptidyl-tRNA hydrolase
LSPITEDLCLHNFKNFKPQQAITMADRTPPTPLAMLIGTAIISCMAGYMIGIASSLGLLPIPFIQFTPGSLPPRKPSKPQSEIESSEEEIDIDSVPLDHAPNWANGEVADRRDGLRQAEPLKVEERERPLWEASNEECKLVLVVRTDLGMTKGMYTLSLSPIMSFLDRKGSVASSFS